MQSMCTVTKTLRKRSDKQELRFGQFYKSLLDQFYTTERESPELVLHFIFFPNFK